MATDLTSPIQPSPKPDQPPAGAAGEVDSDLFSPEPTVDDSTARKRAEAALRARLALEELIAAISTRFVNLPADRVDQEIHRALEIIGRFSGADRTFINVLGPRSATVIQVYTWRAAGLPPLRVAVNLSARQFRQSGLAAMVNQALQDAGLAPEHLELEVTESIMIQDLQTTITTLHQLHELGIQISIDDFGTGYSSLSYLKRLPISKIKIDQSFIRDICTDPEDCAIANAVISLGHGLKMQVIAEGVETLEQLEHLRAQGCDEIQGYYFSRPLPAEAFAQLVREGLAAAKPV